MSYELAEGTQELVLDKLNLKSKGGRPRKELKSKGKKKPKNQALAARKA